MKKLLLILLLPNLALSYTANNGAKTIFTDGSFSDTTNAIAYVALQSQDGWVMTNGVPGSSYTWADTVTINVPFNFTFVGGTPSNPATFTSTYAGGFGITITATPGKLVTVRDFKFAEWSAANGLFLVVGSGLDTFRFTDLTFTHNQGHGTLGWIGDLSTSRTGIGPFGLIDHITNNCSSSGYGWFIRQNQQSGAWTNALPIGTRYNVFIEDSSFASGFLVTGSPAVDSDNGGAWVMRNCVFTNYTIGTHGADSPGPTNSTLWFEAYTNWFTVSGNASQDFCMFLRGGSGVYFGNTSHRLDTSEYNSMLKLAFYRAQPGNGVCTVDRFYPADYLGTMQPGMGPVPGSASADPNFPTRDWVSVPVYAWGNTLTPGTPLRVGVVGAGLGGSDAPFMVQNRDWFLSARPSYTPFAYPHYLQTGSTPDPSITVQPQNQTVANGSTATFSVTASGTAPVTYQWSKNGTPIAGATQSSYTTPTLSCASDQGNQYYAVVTSGVGAQQTQAATLTMTGCALDPAITSQPQSAAVVIGQNATFSVTATGTAPLVYTWKVNGVTVGSNSSSYTRNNCQLADNGSSVTCVITGPGANSPQTSSAATLTVTVGITGNINAATVGIGTLRSP